MPMSDSNTSKPAEGSIRKPAEDSTGKLTKGSAEFSLPDGQRRLVLKFGLLGGLIAASTYLIPPSKAKAATSEQAPVSVNGYEFGFLRPQDINLLAAVAPVVVASNFPAQGEPRQQALARLMISIDKTLLTTSLETQKKIRQLFSLLDFSLFRGVLGGLRKDWSEASEAEIRQFLHRWRDSGMNMLRQGYVVLIQLSTLAYYSEPKNWTQNIYPGPPAHQPST